MPVDEMLYSADAVVVGSGLSGLVAASHIRLPGPGRILILGTGSGASPDISGFNLPLHPEDSAERFTADIAEAGQDQCDMALVRALVEDSLHLAEELEERGFVPDKGPDKRPLLRQPLGSSVPRVVGRGNVSGGRLLGLYREQLRRREEVEFLPGVRAVELLCAGGKVHGLRAWDERAQRALRIEARAVVLASGGFCRIYPFSTNMQDISGDGIAMAYRAGLPLRDMEFVQFEPSAAVWPEAIREKSVITTLFFEGAVLRNAAGERFMLRYGPEGELVNKDVMARRIHEEIAAGRGTPHGGVYFDATGVDPGRLRSAYDLFVQRYQKVGIDICTQPMEIAPAPHTSLGGVVVDAHCATALEGLFACGEIIGGLHGANRIGGNAGLETLVFGRRAGQSVTACLARGSEPGGGRPEENSPPARAGGEELSAGREAGLRREMEACLAEALGVVRNGRDLRAAAGTLEGLLAELAKAGEKNGPAWYRKTRLGNDLQTALLLALAALEREESVGCHIRADFPRRAAERYSVQLRRAAEGPAIEKVSI